MNRQLQGNLLDGIKSGKVCPYCHMSTELVDSSLIYGTSYGMIYLCAKCRAWVGVHKGTDVALGRLANDELREWKKLAHGYFDPLWKRKIEKENCSKKEARGAAYKWLSSKMSLSPEDTHIGLFDVDQCKKVVEICREYHKRKHY
ncbi:hypothetical protein BWD42_04240 [Sphingobacterium sp. CZ-UAM]|uniref:zinc-finger-containing protein n=1 Tax=Sphingobacterium sp. CZ-UAM TaxID=1933868 RepID=UPI0009870920|nr:zinc-finger-containing protein [Sphingobacterium sp. CZ-UAM]OOG19164.1 hypothetical protein BWD42_04240 [Sphingobacterium sp. CZ-UAM]